jgi:hypothetical protein
VQRAAQALGYEMSLNLQALTGRNKEFFVLLPTIILTPYISTLKLLYATENFGSLFTCDVDAENPLVEMCFEPCCALSGLGGNGSLFTWGLRYALHPV